MIKNKAILLYGLGHAVLVFAYVAGVAWILFNGQQIFGQSHSFWGPLSFLLLFVLSASIVGALVLGRPVLLYLDGRKPEALKFFGYTIGWLLAFMFALFLLRPWQ